MKLSISPTPLIDQKKDALIVFYEGSENLLPAGHTVLKKKVDTLVNQSAFKGNAGQTAIFQLDHKQIIVTGIGPAAHFHNGLLEQAASAAVKAGCAAGFKSFCTASSIRRKGLSEADYQILVGRGSGWGTYTFNTFRSSASKPASTSLAFCGPVKDRSAVKTASAHIKALLDTADLANLPGNEATPEKIAVWAKAMEKNSGLTCQIMGKAELTKKGCGGILSVAQGSAEDPKMIVLKHAGTDKKAKPIVLVGKTVTFDTGGISLKSGKGMGWMRYDKCGGMAVLAAMQMIARMKLKQPVIGILGAAENMPGSAATRPGDIIKAYNGKTIEVLNTDAEGRLILADALGLAADMKPQAIVDLATLTGAVIVALGTAASAVLGNDNSLTNDLIKSGGKSGERLWELPLYKEYTDDMKSDFADLANLSKSGGAGTATAAAFLQEFVPDNIPWAHLDIAGTAWVESATSYQDAGATLFGARTLVQWIADKA